MVMCDLKVGGGNTKIKKIILKYFLGNMAFVAKLKI